MPRGSTLAEVIVGLLVFSLFALAILGMLARAAELSQRDAEINQVNQLCTGLLEQTLIVAREAQGYQDLASSPLRAAPDPRYLYAVDVREWTQGHEALNLKKVQVLLYYADPGDPDQPDPRRARGGLALCLGTDVQAP
jgi:Tfp pilus assembly protein PilV